MPGIILDGKIAAEVISLGSERATIRKAAATPIAAGVPAYDPAWTEADAFPIISQIEFTDTTDETDVADAAGTTYPIESTQTVELTLTTLQVSKRILDGIRTTLKAGLYWLTMEMNATTSNGNRLYMVALLKFKSDTTISAPGEGTITFPASLQVMTEDITVDLGAQLNTDNPFRSTIDPGPGTDTQVILDTEYWGVFEATA